VSGGNQPRCCCASSKLISGRHFESTGLLKIGELQVWSDNSCGANVASTTELTTSSSREQTCAWLIERVHSCELRKSRNTRLFALGPKLLEGFLSALPSEQEIKRESFDSVLLSIGLMAVFLRHFRKVGSLPDSSAFEIGIRHAAGEALRDLRQSKTVGGPVNRKRPALGRYQRIA
jgi:hypothetical protein